MSNPFRRDGLIGAVLVENGEDDIAELAGDGADGGEMVLAAGAEGLVVLREDGVAKSRPGGGQPDGPPEVRRAPFGDFLPCSGKFSGLCDPDIQPGESNQLVRCVEAVDVPDLPQDDGAQSVPDAGNGGDVAAGLLQQRGNLFLQLCNLSLQKLQLLDELPDLKSKGVFGKTHPKRTGCRSLQLLRFLFSKPAMTGLF